MRRARSGFTLLEVMCAVVITATALVAMQATVSGAITSAGDSINHRAGRELARAKMEEILVEIIPPDGSGGFDDYPGFTWSARTVEQTIGTDESSGEIIRVVILQVSYPIEAGGDPAIGEGGRETIELVSVLPPEETGGGGP